VVGHASVIQASIVIPTRNRADLLARCLASLTEQTLDPERFEVIVVDNGSTDRTVETAAGFSNRLNLRCISAPDPGLHVGRHAGMRAARSDVLMYADDDIEAAPTWVESVVRTFSAGADLVGGNNHPRFESEPPDWLRQWWEQPVYRGRALGYLSVLDFGTGSLPIDWQYVWGCNFSIRRRVLEAIGGFHPDGMPQELLHLRGDGESHVAQAVHHRGGKIWFDSGASVHHLVSSERMTLQYFQRRAFSQGVSDSYATVRRTGSSNLRWKDRLRFRLRPRLAAIRERWRLGGQRRSPEPSLLDIKLAVLDAWREGVRFHGSALKSDPDLLSWVLKSHYLS
jgi:glycosyltransferase involved in cell wall biosynthesis